MGNKQEDLAIAHSGISKVERYQWRTDTKKGELKWVNKQDITSDDDYQRDSWESKIRKIASNWSWPAFGVIILAKRKIADEFGKYYFAVDGKHRHAASLRRADVQELPAIVFEFDSLKEEAKAFLDGNLNRKPLTSTDKVAAQEVTGDPNAAIVLNLIRTSGREVSPHRTNKSVRCIAALMKMAKSDADRLRSIWPLICELCEGVEISEVLVTGLFYLEGHASSSLLDKRWRRRVLQVGLPALTEGARRTAAAFARGGDKQWGLGMLEAINRGLRQKLELTESVR